MALRTGKRRRREGHRIQGHVSQARQRRGRHPRSCVGLHTGGRSALQPDRGGTLARCRSVDVLDSRQHQRRRSARRAQRVRRQQAHRSEGQDARRAVCVDVALPCARRLASGGRGSVDGEDRQSASRSRGGVGARQYRRNLHLGSGARQDQAERKGAHHVGRGREGIGQGDVRRLRRAAQVRAGQSRLPERFRQGCSPIPMRNTAITRPTGPPHRNRCRRSRRNPTRPPPTFPHSDGREPHRARRARSAAGVLSAAAAARVSAARRHLLRDRRDREDRRDLARLFRADRDGRARRHEERDPPSR